MKFFCWKITKSEKIMKFWVIWNGTPVGKIKKIDKMVHSQNHGLGMLVVIVSDSEIWHKKR